MHRGGHTGSPSARPCASVRENTDPTRTTFSPDSVRGRMRYRNVRRIDPGRRWLIENRYPTQDAANWLIAPNLLMVSAIPGVPSTAEILIWATGGNRFSKWDSAHFSVRSCTRSKMETKVFTGVYIINAAGWRQNRSCAAVNGCAIRLPFRNIDEYAANGQESHARRYRGFMAGCRSRFTMGSKTNRHTG